MAALTLTDVQDRITHALACRRQAEQDGNSVAAELYDEEIDALFEARKRLAERPMIAKGNA